MNDIILARSVFKKPVDNLVVVEALKFRQEWNKFLEFVTPDDKRKQFFTAYKNLKDDGHALDRWKDEVTKEYPNFFDENDPLRVFLDRGGESRLISILHMDEYRRALESVSLSKWLTIKEAIKRAAISYFTSTPNLLDGIIRSYIGKEPATLIRNYLGRETSKTSKSFKDFMDDAATEKET